MSAESQNAIPTGLSTYVNLNSQRVFFYEAFCEPELNNLEENLSISSTGRMIAQERY